VNTSAVNIAVVDGKTITQSQELRTAQQGDPVRIKAVRGGSYILAESEKGVAPENVTIKRVGKDLHLSLEGAELDQPHLIIEDFYGSDSQLVGMAEDGAYYDYIASDAEQDHEAAFLMDGNSSAQVLGSSPLLGFANGLAAASGVSLWPAALLGLGALALAGAAYALGKHNGDKNKHDGGAGGDGDGGILPGAPATPNIGGAHDDVGTTQGPIDKGGVTDDKTPTFTGTGTPGNTIIIRDNGKPIGEVVVDEDGKWEFTPTHPLPEGPHVIVVVEKDPTGNLSDPSDEFDFIVDTTAPGKSVINDIIDDIGDVQGSIPNGGHTDDNRPTLTGTGEAGARIEIFANGEKIGETTVNADGSWAFTPADALADGEYVFTTVAIDAAGNVGLPSDPHSIIVDTVAPDKGVIGDVIDDEGLVVGPIDNGGVTDDSKPTITGGGTPGDTVIVIVDGKPIGETIVDEDGNWSFTPEDPLDDGSHEIVVVIRDPAGNESEPSDPHVIIVDTSAPDKPTIESVFDNQGDQQGDLAAGDTTDDATPTISGRAEPNSTVIIYDNGVEIGRAPVGADGTWTFEPTLPLLNGGHNLTVEAVDAAGNVSEPSDGFDFDLVAGGTPPAPAITEVRDNVGDAQGAISPGGVTDDPRPVIIGTAGAGSTVTVYVGGVAVGTALVGQDGRWEYTFAEDLADGNHIIAVEATDLAGNTSPPTADFPIVVDTTAPDAAVIGELSDNVGPMTGVINDGDTTDDSTPTFTGTAEPNTTLIILDNGVEIGRVPVDGDGNWTFEPAPELLDGAHSFTTVVEDAAGNQSPESTPIDFIVDTSAVAISISHIQDNEGPNQGALASGSVTDDTTPTLHGQATAGATVNIYLDGVLRGTALVDDNGNWSFTPDPALADGSYAFTATVVTDAGGESAPTADFNLVIDSSAPGRPAIDDVTDDVGDIRGPIADGGVTDDSNPDLSGGGLQPGDTVYIYDNGELLGTVPVDGNGNWVFRPDTPLNDGEHQFTIIAEDEAGNRSDESDPHTIIVDTVAPLAQAEVTSMGKDSGANSGDFVTNDGTAGRLIQGRLTALLDTDEKVQVSTDGGATWVDVLLSDDGTWSVIDQNSHSGNWTIQTRVMDPAGNSNASSQLVTLDTTVDAPTSVTWDGSTIEASFDGAGVEIGDKLHIVIDGFVVEHVLTETDIEAGSVALAWSSIEHGNADDIGVALVDQAGNVSSYQEFLRESNVVFEEGFSDQTSTRFSAGQTFSLPNFELSILNVANFVFTSGFGSSNQGVGTPPRSMALEMAGNGTQYQMDLSGAETISKVSFTVGDLTTTELLTAVFFDQDGSPVFEAVRTAADGSITEISFELPYGLNFSSMTLTLSGNNAPYIWIDDMEFGHQEYVSGGELVGPDINQTILQDDVRYYGGDVDNVFSLADVSLLDGSDSGINAGAGQDTLQLTGANQILDFTALGEKLVSIEVIDLTGSGNNTLRLSLEDILNHGETSLFHDSGKTQMMVNGDAGDVVDLSGLIGDTDPGDWSQMSGTVTVGGNVYEVYQHSTLGAELLVQEGVQTNLV
jgi:hypothetical protein